MHPPADEETNIRRSIFDKCKWLLSKNLPFVIHNDLDGILCAMVLSQELDWKLIGFYDLKRVWFDQEYDNNLFSPVYVDLDVTNPNAKSIGHHWILNFGPNHINPNIIFSEYTNGNFERKYPLGTIIFLTWLYGLELPNNLIAKHIILHADTPWKSYYGKFPENVSHWLDNTFGYTELVHLLRDREGDFERFLKDNVIDELEQIGFTTGRGGKPSNILGLGPWQCKFSLTQWNTSETAIERVIELIRFLSQHTGWKRIDLPVQIKEKRVFRGITVESNDVAVFEPLLNILGDRVFSHSLTEFRRLKVSLWI